MNRNRETEVHPCNQSCLDFDLEQHIMPDPEQPSYSDAANMISLASGVPTPISKDGGSRDFHSIMDYLNKNYYLGCDPKERQALGLLLTGLSPISRFGDDRHIELL